MKCVFCVPEPDRARHCARVPGKGPRAPNGRRRGSDTRVHAALARESILCIQIDISICLL